MKIHRWFNKSFSTYCGRSVRDVSVTRFDRKVTCRVCLRSMGRFSIRRHRLDGPGTYLEIK